MFAYCQNNPISFTDSTGHALTPAGAAAIAGGLYGLLSYLITAEEPTVKGALLAITTGVVGAVVGFYAGGAKELIKLGLSAFAGMDAALSAWVTEAENGNDVAECLSAALNAFVTSGGITYLCSYIEFPMLQGAAEAAAVFDVTLLSGFVATALSFPVAPICDTIAASLTYAPEYSHTYYVRSKDSGGLGKASYSVISVSF